jgi:hypothetical protein
VISRDSTGQLFAIFLEVSTTFASLKGRKNMMSWAFHGATIRVMQTSEELMLRLDIAPMCVIRSVCLVKIKVVQSKCG